METLTELVKIIKNNIDKDFVKIKETPKRCVFKELYHLKKVPGYFVTFYYPEHDYEDSLFISDTQDKQLFHNAPSLFITHYFEFRCRWASQNEVDFIEPYGFYI